MDYLESHILHEILRRSKALPKNDIDHLCTFNNEFTSDQVRNALAALRKSGRIIEFTVPRVEGEDSKYFTLENCSEAKRKRCEQIIRDRLEKVVISNVLGETGQEYIRCLFRYVRDVRDDDRFSQISAKTFRRTKQKLRLNKAPKKKLGRIILRVPNTEGEEEKADLIVVYRNTYKLLVESKNQLESIGFPSHKEDELTKLIGQCLRNKMQPFLVCNRLDERAKRLCETYGIVFLELGRQILPNTKRMEAKKLYHPDILAERFQFVNSERPFRERGKPLDPRSIRDVEALMNHALIDDARQRWIDGEEEVRLIYKALTSNPVDRTVLDFLVL